MDDFLHGGQVSDMTEEINILKKKMRELEGQSLPNTEDTFYDADSVYYALPDNNEHDIYSFTLVGGDLSTDHILEGCIAFLYSGDGSAARTITFKLYYKLTTITCIMQVPTTGAVTNQLVRIHFSVSANAATNAQYMILGVNRYGETGYHISVSGTSAVDSTASETVKVSAQRNNAANGGKFIYGYAHLYQP
jgi:hypothetical protein